jgi:hypothetical protein
MVAKSKAGSAQSVDDTDCGSRTGGKPFHPLLISV